jgi:hypothetical protein
MDAPIRQARYFCCASSDFGKIALGKRRETLYIARPGVPGRFAGPFMRVFRKA